MKEKFKNAKNKVLKINFKNSIEKQREKLTRANKLKEDNYNGLGLEKQKPRDTLSQPVTNRQPISIEDNFSNNQK